LEREVCSCAELSSLVTESGKKHVRRRARFQQYGDASCHQVFFCLQGKAPKEIHAILIETLREHAPSYAIVKNWVAQFKLGDFSTHDAPRPGRPKTVTTPEIIDQIHELILGDRRILTKSMSEQLLEFFRRDPNDFLSLLVTMDEAWLYHYDPETKQQSMKWLHSGSPRPKKFLLQKSSGKVLASIFWNEEGILPIDYLPKCQTINAEYYLSLLVQFKDILKGKRCGKITKVVLFLHENAPAHRALATQKKLAYLGFQCLVHQPYSPNLAPSEYHLFHGLKRQLKVRPISSDAEVIAAAETWLDGQLSDFFFEWLANVRARG